MAAERRRTAGACAITVCARRQESTAADLYWGRMCASEKERVNMCSFFFFQAEDGIRDLTVTGVQTCALPIFAFHPDPRVRDGAFTNNPWLLELPDPLTKIPWDNAAVLSPRTAGALDIHDGDQIGRASCRERV